jgi:hypothetical protein
MSSIGKAQTQLDYFKNIGGLDHYHPALLAAVIQYYVVMLFISRGSQEYQIVSSPFQVFKMTEEVLGWAKNNYFTVNREVWMGEVILSAFINQIGESWNYEERESPGSETAYNLLVGYRNAFGNSRRALKPPKPPPRAVN